MGRAGRDELLRKMGRLRSRIERWRQARTKRSPMPEELWSEATELGRVCGVYRTSQDLGVNYESLRARIERSSGRASSARQGGQRRSHRAPISGAPKFVELATMPTVVESVGAAGVLIEVQEATGSKLTIRLGTASTIDVCAVLASFREPSFERHRR